MQKKSLDALVIVFLVLLVILGLTWVIPAGTYERTVINGKTVLVPGTFEYLEAQGVSFWRIFTSPVAGFVAAGEVIAFVLLIGGAFGIVTKSNAMEAGLQSVVQYAYKYPNSKSWLVAILVFFFSLAGGTFGMAEEVLVFILITIPLAKDLGYDRLTGVAIPFVGSAVGFAGAAFNPFTVGIAHGLSDLTPFSGAGYRMLVWLIFTLLAIGFIVRHAKKSVAAKVSNNQDVEASLGRPDPVVFTGSHKIILLLFAMVLGLLIYGAKNWGWYIEEIAGLFIAFGILVGIIARFSASEVSKAFVNGASELLMAALVIGLSRAVLVIAEEGQIIDTMLFALSNSVSELPKAVAAQSMFLVQAFINFFIPSGSGQAALTMPVMAPLSDLLGISRQTAVLCYQLGDGIFNLIIPTSGVTMGILSLAGIPYKEWIKWIWKFMLLLTLTSMLLIGISVVFEVW